VREIHVAAGAISDARKGILLTRRADHLHQGGLWEFPGGKLEAGESPHQALSRELQEELGISPQLARPLIRLRHDYGDRVVVLHVFEVSRFHGTARPREDQAMAWVVRERLKEYPMPAADRPIVTALQLPDRYLITGADPKRPEEFLARLELALAGGIGLVQLRAHGLAAGEYLALARESVRLCQQQGARILLNTKDPEVVEASGADGLHLTSSALAATHQRPLAPHHWLAASCHNPQELDKALAIGADFALLSPVAKTRSHPDASPLGWERFAEMVRDLPLPVFALGGMTADHLEIAQQQGGQGIAAISGLWPVRTFLGDLKIQATR
jgi:8-oxo-dGTP diphosphatase